jgi:hypothetical protein
MANSGALSIPFALEVNLKCTKLHISALGMQWMQYSKFISRLVVLPLRPVRHLSISIGIWSSGPW